MSRRAEERTFTTQGGVELFYRYWPAVAAAGIDEWGIFTVSVARRLA